MTPRSAVVVVVLAVTLLTQTAFANFPRNNLRFLEGSGQSNVTQQQFNLIIDNVVKVWAPFAAEHKAQLVTEKLWQDSTVNAEAEMSPDGQHWTLRMFGGMARHPAMTPDGFVLVVCHELGHLFGGHYFVHPEMPLSAEGQADYFATQVCAKKIFTMFPQQNMRFREGAPDVVNGQCGAVYGGNQESHDICVRSAAAGLALARVLNSMESSNAGQQVPQPNFNTPDRRRVSRTYTGHPAAQCRLDTYFAGALCNARWNPHVIPGSNARNINSVEAEMEAAKYSCTASSGQQIGVRPSCWFKSQIGAPTRKF